MQFLSPYTHSKETKIVISILQNVCVWLHFNTEQVDGAVRQHLIGCFNITNSQKPSSYWGIRTFACEDGDHWTPEVCQSWQTAGKSILVFELMRWPEMEEQQLENDQKWSAVQLS